MAFSAHHVSQAIVDKSDDNQLTNEKIVSVYNFRMNENANFYAKKNIEFRHRSSFRTREPCLQYWHVLQAGVIFDRMTDAGFFAEK